MDGEITDIVRGQALPLGGLIEAGVGFRIGSPDIPFALAEREQDRWTYLSTDRSLRVESRVRRLGACLVVSRRLENVGMRPTPAIDVIEPLHLVLRQPLDRWRNIFANGGTSENYYPPTAFRTEEWSRSSEEAFSIESDPGGRSSNKHLPLLVSLASRAPDSDGLFCGMEWSAGWYMRSEKLTDGTSSLSAGVKVNGIRLSPGESLRLPDVHLGFFTGGPTAATNSLRRYLYEKVCPKIHGRSILPPVSYDHFFGIWRSFDVGLLTAEAERAAELGVEVFVVDGRWYRGGNYKEGLGNWEEVDRVKFPDGLEPLAHYVRELGMDFGLWFEPEHAVEGSALLLEHPEWFVPLPGLSMGGPLTGRRQSYHLNLSRREAQEYVVEMVGGWIKRLGLRWIRWDYNVDPQPFWEAADPSLKVQFGYLEGLYRVLDTLMEQNPDCMIEGCASGGRRIDIGTMKRAHTFWISDHWKDPFVCRYMQARANRFLPGHLLNRTVAVSLDQGDDGFDDTAVLSRMLGKLAFDGDIASWSPQLTQQMAIWVGEFKEIRHLLVQDFYQLLPIPTAVEDWDAVQFASYSGDEALLFVFAGSGGGRRKISLRGMKDGDGYVVRRRPGGQPASVLGSKLQTEGLPVELGPGEGALWRIVLTQ